MDHPSELRLFTVGHGTLAEVQFASVLLDAGVGSAIDVRSFPGSRRHPQFGRSAMETWLPARGICYRWEPRLGGFRKPVAGSPNSGLRHPSFRAYADHMATAEFVGALAEVMGEAADRPVAVVCSESLWWRCHRRLVADASMLLHGAAVEHLALGRPPSPHRLTSGATTDEEGRMLYPPQPPLPLGDTPAQLFGNL
ncbi:MAG: DUF488 domain-containing protein [Actinomycetota bacterium]|nr:DUF488 domain-containing protein [Actinomycetota bacterium]